MCELYQKVSKFSIRKKKKNDDAMELDEQLNLHWLRSMTHVIRTHTHTKKKRKHPTQLVRRFVKNLEIQLKTTIHLKSAENRIRQCISPKNEKEKPVFLYIVRKSCSVFRLSVLT